MDGLRNTDNPLIQSLLNSSILKSRLQVKNFYPNIAPGSNLATPDFLP